MELFLLSVSHLLVLLGLQFLKLGDHIFLLLTESLEDELSVVQKVALGSLLHELVLVREEAGAFHVGFGHQRLAEMLRDLGGQGRDFWVVHYFPQVVLQVEVRNLDAYVLE